MHHALRLALVAAIAAASLASPAPAAQAQAAPAVQVGKLVFTAVADWEQRGSRDGIQVINNADGELRLDAGATRGVFLSEPIATTFPFNAVGAVWNADAPPGTTLLLEVRGGPSAGQLGAWQPLLPGEASPTSTPGAQATEGVRPFSPDTAVIQVSATLSTTVANASPLLSDISISYFNTIPGPPRPLAGEAVPTRSGPAVLTPAPRVFERTRWAGGIDRTYRGERRAPAGIVLHQVGADSVDDPAPYLRALAAFQTDVLGWGDTPYHYLIDRSGGIYEGHLGGPTAATPQLAGGAAVHVALIGDGAPPQPQLDALRGLLAWLGQAYEIAPGGQRPLGANGATLVVPTIAAHSEIAAAASDPSGAVRQALPQIRQAADAATVRSRWYFAEGNPRDYEQRLAVLNPGTTPAAVRFIILRPGQPLIRETTVAPGQRADLVVNQVFNDVPDAPAVVEANAPVIAERFMDFGGDMTAGIGAAGTSRVWYFAEGSTEGDRQTFLVLFNPQSTPVDASVLFMLSDGRSGAPRSITIPPLERRVIVVNDLLPDAGFGMRVIASQPIVAERTMIFGAGSTLTSGGVHTAPGVTTLSREWHFAEGTTAAPFRMQLLVLNPNVQPASVTVRFLTQDGTSLARRYAIPAGARLAIDVNEVVPELGVATTVQSDRPVAAERALAWRNGGAGTAGPGATAPAFTWRFADGRTSGDYQQYLLISNPSRSQARVTVDYILADGTPASQSLVMPATSRYTVAVHQVHPGQASLSTTVRATQPVVVERSIYAGAPDQATSRGGETSLGVPEAQR